MFRLSKFRNLFLGLGILVASLGLTEVVLKVFFPIARIRTQARGEGNALGWGPDLHEECPSLPTNETPSGKHRVMLLGDSILNCWERKEHFEKVPGNLQILWDGTDYEVLNLSAGGWGTDQETLAYETIGRRYHPATVLLFFTPVNDLWNNLSSRGLTPPLPKPRFTLSASGELSQIPARFRLKGVWEHLAPYLVKTQMGLRVLTKMAASSEISEMGIPHPNLAAFQTPPLPEIEQAWRVTARILQRLKAEVAQDGARLAVVYVPSGADTGEAGCSERRCIGYDAPPLTYTCRGESLTFDIWQPYRRLKSILADLEIPLIDNVDEMKPYGGDHEQVAYDCLHLTPMASELLAKRIVSWMNASGGPIGPPPHVEAANR